MEWIQTVLGRDMAELVISACRKITAEKSAMIVSSEEFLNNYKSLYQDGWYFATKTDEEHILLERRR